MGASLLASMQAAAAAGGANGAAMSKTGLALDSRVSEEIRLHESGGEAGPQMEWAVHMCGEGGRVMILMQIGRSHNHQLSLLDRPTASAARGPCIKCFFLLSHSQLGPLSSGAHTAITDHMALEGVTSLGAMTVKTKGCIITWGP